MGCALSWLFELYLVSFEVFPELASDDVFFSGTYATPLASTIVTDSISAVVSSCTQLWLHRPEICNFIQSAQCRQWNTYSIGKLVTSPSRPASSRYGAQAGARKLNMRVVSM
jgi:hypothetical protein